ncbi:hypothetical protein BLOT_001026 [Blomia tropicalis]|nr:hypothetical protein BLOT_001026 [Blomia tropicalis]
MQTANTGPIYGKMNSIVKFQSTETKMNGRKYTKLYFLSTHLYGQLILNRFTELKIFRMLLFRFQNRIGSGNLTRRKDEMALGIFVFDLLK